MIKRLYLDLETLGIDFRIHPIYRASGIIDFDGVIQEEFDLTMRPKKGKYISSDALSLLSITKDSLYNEPSSEEQFIQFTEILERHFNRRQYSDKYFLVGYNIHFDEMFLRQWFQDEENDYYGSYFWWPHIDVAVLYGELFAAKRHNFPNFKLETLSKLVGLPYEINHDSVSDIHATRDLHLKLINTFEE